MSPEPTNIQETPSPSSNFDLGKIRRLVLSLLLALFVFILGFALGSNGYRVKANGIKVNISRELPPEQETLDFELFWQVWDTLEDAYFDKGKIKEADLVWGAIKGMVAAVGDPYTVFLTPDEQRVTQEDLSGNFEGVGIQIGFIGSQLAVVAPLTGSPAEEAGIEAGDIIAGIKDATKDVERGTVGITLPEAVQLIRGPAGTTVTLSLLREDEETPVVLDIVRREINVPSVTLEFVGDAGDVGDLKVLKFAGETLSEWEKAVLEIQKKQDLAGIIVDLRNNPGGYLQGAVDLGSEFLDNGEVVVVEEYGDGSKNEFFVERAGRLTRESVVVLVNGGSASASEILAGALRDIKKSPIVGETTFGKGTVQEAKQLEAGTGLHITVARWLTPSGFWVNQGGLVPDYEQEDDPDTSEDEQLTQAIDIINNFSSLSER
jgi:carboxyl-terminal processing protease